MQLTNNLVGLVKYNSQHAVYYYPSLTLINTNACQHMGYTKAHLGAFGYANAHKHMVCLCTLSLAHKQSYSFIHWLNGLGSESTHFCF